MSLTTDDILQTFTAQIMLHKGQVTSTYNDGRRLLTRGTIPQSENVQPKDRLQAGVALKANQRQLSIYPYIYRQVCSNGAIMAQTIESRQIAGLAVGSPTDTIAELKSAIDACCQPHVFTSSVKQIRSALTSQADSALNLLELFSRIKSIASSPVASEIIRRFIDSEDQSPFALMNAITSVARDTRHPQTKWKLEKLGGSIPALISNPPPSKPRKHSQKIPALSTVA